MTWFFVALVCSFGCKRVSFLLLSLPLSLSLPFLAPATSCHNRRKFAKDLQAELREDYSTNLRDEWDLENPEWRYDDIPEIVDGKNVVDFVDPDLDEKLAMLEEEEAERKAAGEYDSDSEDEDTKSLRARAKLLRQRRMMFRVASQRKQKRNSAVLPIKIRRRLAEAEERRLARLDNPNHGAASDDDDDDDDDAMDSDYDEDARGRRGRRGDGDGAGRSRSASRARSRTPLKYKKGSKGKAAKDVKGVAPEAAERRKKPVSLRAQGGVQSATVRILRSLCVWAFLGVCCLVIFFMWFGAF